MLNLRAIVDKQNQQQDQTNQNQDDRVSALQRRLKKMQKKLDGTSPAGSNFPGGNNS